MSTTTPVWAALAVALLAGAGAAHAAGAPAVLLPPEDTPLLASRAATHAPRVRRTAHVPGKCLALLAMARHDDASGSVGMPEYIVRAGLSSVQILPHAAARHLSPAPQPGTGRNGSRSSPASNRPTSGPRSAARTATACRDRPRTRAGRSRSWPRAARARRRGRG